MQNTSLDSPRPGPSVIEQACEAILAAQRGTPL
jgi:hypothetical protein